MFESNCVELMIPEAVAVLLLVGDAPSMHDAI